MKRIAKVVGISLFGVAVGAFGEGFFSGLPGPLNRDGAQGIGLCRVVIEYPRSDPHTVAISSLASTNPAARCAPHNDAIAIGSAALRLIESN